jgi:hypothetical protein
MGIPAGDTQGAPSRSAAMVMLDIRGRCESWARWASGSRGYQRSITGKLMDGLGSTTCRTCGGRRRVEGWKVGSTDPWVDPCPDCNGLGRINGSLDPEPGFIVVECHLCELHVNEITGERRRLFMGEICPRCAGDKKYRIRNLKINPAGIRATRYAGANEDDDPVSLLIDRTISLWRSLDATFWIGEILVMEYIENGTQEAKARSRRASQGWYSKTLACAHGELEAILKNNFDNLS